MLLDKCPTCNTDDSRLWKVDDEYVCDTCLWVRVPKTKLTIREYYILKELFNASGNMMRCATLIRKCNKEHIGFQKKHAKFYLVDMTPLFDGLWKRGLIGKMILQHNLVYVGITEFGKRVYLFNKGDKKHFYRRVKRILEVRFWRSNQTYWGDITTREEHYSGLKEVEILLTHKDLLRLYKHKAKRALGISIHHRGGLNERALDDDHWKFAWKQVERIRKPDDESLKDLKKWCFDHAKTHAVMLHKQEVKRYGDYGLHVRREPLGQCFFCGNDIHVKEAHDDAKLLEKYGGAKSGMVCCSCHNHIRWLEKNIGGVLKVAEARI